MMEQAKPQSVIWFNSSNQPVLKCVSSPQLADVINCTIVLSAVKEGQLSDSYTCQASSDLHCTTKTIDVPIGKRDVVVFTDIGIQLFRRRLSKKSVKAYATIPKGNLGNIQ